MILVIDLDGTIANNDHRNIYIETEGKKDWDKYFDPELMKQDIPFLDARYGMHRISKLPNTHLLFLTGRPQRTRGVTAWWIYNHFGWNTFPLSTEEYFNSVPRENYAPMIMRSDKDRRPANVYKEGWVKWIAQRTGNRPIIFVDDDERCYEMYWLHGVVLRPPAIWSAFG
jgi:hypothetical protein